MGADQMAMSAETSKQIRANLKAAGYGARDVSVRNDSYSMGSTVRVRIKRAEVSLNDVHRIAIQNERVSRDEATGEILSGGNTFVDVAYEHGALDAATDLARAALDAGRTVFGEFRITEDSTYSSNEQHLWRTDANGVGAHILRLWRDGAAEGLARTLATVGQLALLDPAPAASDVVALAQAWQRAYPCPDPNDCPELAALWVAAARL